MHKYLCRLLSVLCLAGLLPVTVQAADILRLATTTSTDNSGLLAALHPVFTERTGIGVHTIAVGTGKALKLGANGDVDVVLVHAPGAEQGFIDQGHGLKRIPVMYNDFVLLGPASDPAAIGTAATALEAMQRIADSRQVFISRGDDSGTHKKEASLWQAAERDPMAPHLLEVGQGMGRTLAIADDKLAYTLSDRGTWLALRHRFDLKLLYQGDVSLFNPYHVIAVNPERHSLVREDLARRYIDFLTSTEGQQLIAAFRLNDEILFHPNATNDSVDAER